MRCLACGLDSPPGMSFCGRCGASLGGARRGDPKAHDDDARRALYAGLELVEPLGKGELVAK